MLRPVQFIVIFLLISFCLLALSLSNGSLFITPAFAQTNPYAVPNNNPDVPQNLHTWTQNVMVEVMSSLSCQLTGVDPITKDHKCLGVDQKTGKIGFVEQGGGAIVVVGNLIAQTYKPPLHTTDYFAYLGQNFGFAKKAHAQGVGFNSLSPLAGLWTAFRNIVYLLFVIVFVVIGFAIMLRVKIDPRTVMSVENQIPKIIIGLVMVTFSFAIAGLVIDMMYVSMYVVYGVVSSIPGVHVTELNPVTMQGTTPMGAVGGIGSPLSKGGVNGLVNGVALSTSGVIKEMLGISDEIIPIKDFFHIDVGLAPPSISTPVIKFPTFTPVTTFDWMIHVASLIGAITMGGRVGQILDSIPVLAAIPSIAVVPLTFIAEELAVRQALPFLIPYLILFIAVLYALIRLWFQLIIAYVYFLLDVVLAPFWILGGLFPGSPIGFGPWMREILANLSAFPVAIGLFLIGKVFYDMFGTTPATGQFFVPPLIGNAAQPNYIGSLIAIGIILLTPQVVNITRDLFKPPPFKYSAGIGQALGVGAGFANIPKHATSLGQFMYYKENYFSKLPIVGEFIHPTRGKPSDPNAPITAAAG